MMRILILAHSFNSLAQRLYAELAAAGHELSVELDINDAITREAVALWQPDLILAPFLKRAIPEIIWRNHLCLVVHPGPPGDRGPSALDWAIMRGETSWGVTVLQAEEAMDAGPVWAWRIFPLRVARKSSVYRTEVTEAAVAAVFEAIERLRSKAFTPRPAAAIPAAAGYGWNAPMTQRDRHIDWCRDTTETVLRKLHAADGVPGVVDEIDGLAVRVFDAWGDSSLSGPPGKIIARSETAICRATANGAVWIGHLKLIEAGNGALKLPATQVLDERLAAPLAAPRFDAFGVADEFTGIRYREQGRVGYLHFDFYNGAMSTRRCRDLLSAFERARARPTRVIVLMGGDDFWSNGLDLNAIEAAASPADESWRNIEAMDDLARAIITTDSHLTISAIRANAGAGGVFLALAADRLYVREGVVLNPHYMNMGNLYGSEYWTYLLPGRIGERGAQEVMAHRLPMLAVTAARIGLADGCLPAAPVQCVTQVEELARELAENVDFDAALEAKRAQRDADEAQCPLAVYRADELAHLKLNFYGFDPSYHVARYRFVHHVPHAWTPLHLARHRQLGFGAQRAQSGS